MISPDLLKILACPICQDRPALELIQDRLVCPSCQTSFPIVNGIPHLVAEEGTDSNSKS